MTITELQWSTLSANTITPECRNTLETILAAINQWLEGHGTQAVQGRDNNGRAVFRQVEDTTTILMAHEWESIEQAREWQESNDYSIAMSQLLNHITQEKTSRCYLETAIFAPPPSETTVPLLKSPTLSIGQCSVAPEHKAHFFADRTRVKPLLDDFARPHQVKDSWKVKGVDEEQEFVFVCGWPSVERHMEFAKTEQFPTYVEAHRKHANAFDVKHYHRIL